MPLGVDHLVIGHPLAVPDQDHLVDPAARHQRADRRATGDVTAGKREQPAAPTSGVQRPHALGVGLRASTEHLDDTTSCSAARMLGQVVSGSRRQVISWG